MDLLEGSDGRGGGCGFNIHPILELHALLSILSMDCFLL